MNKSIIHDITPAPWDDEIVDSITQSKADTIATKHLPEMLVALRMIADPWEIRKELLFGDDASVIFEMAGIARKVLQKIEDEYSKDSAAKDMG
jgi:hypothetical protein